MLARVYSCAVVGLDGVVVEVEVDTHPGLPKVVVVGLPDAAIQESRERVASAIKNSGFEFPRNHITINLAPASVRKAGPVYDLPIALGILAASGQIPAAGLQGSLPLGELSLDGAAHLRGEHALHPFTAEPHSTESDAPPAYTDLREVKGQEQVKRALEVAAAGGHNLLMTGAPGAGKTLMARALPGILPELNLDEALDVTRIYSVSDKLNDSSPLIRTRPFRAPHHTISHAGLVGGGTWPQPGEISLAHRGVLFLDELVEFAPRVLEVLRQPIEDKIVTISRAQGALTFPANFQLVGAMNPCPCGYYGDPVRACTCAPGTVTRYQKRLSGPLLDRIDIHVEVPRVDYEKLSDERLGESSAAVRAPAASSTPASPGCLPTPTLTWAWPRCAASASWMPMAAPWCAPPWRRCYSPHAPTTACSSWRAPSPTWLARKT